MIRAGHIHLCEQGNCPTYFEPWFNYFPWEESTMPLYNDKAFDSAGNTRREKIESLSSELWVEVPVSGWPQNLTWYIEI